MQRRAGRHLRHRARQLHWEYIRDRPWLVVLYLAAGAILVAATALLAPDRIRPYLVGALAASSLWYLAITVVIGSGSANWMQGLEGEEFTSDSLRRLRRRGWMIIDDIPVPGLGNIDHALVGPGGAYAVESKHPRQPLTGDYLRVACQQAKEAAETLHHLLATEDIKVRTPVTPVVVVWGQAIEDPVLADVTVLAGHDLRRWRDSLSTGTLDAEQIARAETGLLELVRTREEHQRRREGPPPLIVELGPFGILNRLTTGVGAGLASWGTAGVILKALGGSGLIPVLIGISLLGLALWRLQRVRILAVGWLTGAAGLWLLLAAFYVADWLR